MITMRLFAEEKRTGTIELLVTSPITRSRNHPGQVAGARWSCTLSMLGISLLSMLLLFAYGKPDWRPMLVGYLGLLLQGGCLLAIGTFISTCTKNQIVAGVAGFGVCLLLWVLDWVSSNSTPRFSERVLSYLSVHQHFDSFSKGVLDSKDIVYYVSVIFVGCS